MTSLDITDFPYLRQIGDGIFQSDQPIVKLSKNEITFLKSEAINSGKKRARICAHHSNDDLLHEMIIAICSDSYIHPHRHLKKSESFHIIEGEVDIVIFSDSGDIEELIELGDSNTSKNFFYRLDEAKYHTLLIHSDILVVHEVTNGPFSRELTELAPFAPGEEDADKASSFIRSVKDKLY